MLLVRREMNAIQKKNYLAIEYCRCFYLKFYGTNPGIFMTNKYMGYRCSLLYLPFANQLLPVPFFQNRFPIV